MTGSCDLLSVAVATSGAGEGLHTSLGTGSSLGDLLGVAVLAHGGVHDIVDGILLNGIAVVPNHGVAIAVLSTNDVRSLVGRTGAIVLGTAEDHIGALRHGHAVDVIGAVVGVEGSLLAGECRVVSGIIPVVDIHIGPQPVVLEVDGDVLDLSLSLAADGAGAVHEIVAGSCDLLCVAVTAGAGEGLHTGLGAGSSLGDLLGVAVTGSGHLISGVSVTTGAAGVGGVASFSTGGSGNLSRVIVTDGRNFLGVAAAALGAGVGQFALLGASGSLGLLGGVAVIAVNIQDVVLFNSVDVVPGHPVAIAILSIGNVRSLIGCAGTIVLGSVEDNVRTLQDGNAVDVVSAIVGVEGGRSAGPCDHGAILSPNIGIDISPQPVVLEVDSDVLGIGISLAADRAAAVDVGVTQSRDFLGVAVAAGAGEGLHAGLGAGSSLGDLLGVAMTGSGHLISGVSVTTGAADISSIASLSTGGSGDLGGVVMADSRDLLGVAVAALGAGVGLHTGLGAGSSLGDLLGVAVTGSSYLISGVSVTTGAADISSIASLSTGGSGDLGGVVMADSRDLLGVAVATDRADEGLHAGFGTGGVLGDLLGVAVIALSDLVAQHQSLIVVHHQSEGDLHAAGNVQLVGICQTQLVIVQNDGLGIAVALGLVPA